MTTRLGADERRRIQRTTAWAVAALFIAVAVSMLMMLVPYTAGVSRQRSSALHFWLHGCPDDDGEAWSAEPFDFGQRARRDCRNAAFARTGVAVGSILVGAGVLLVGQIGALALAQDEDNSTWA